MRILHVIPAYYPAVRYGGPIRSVHGLAAALVRRGHEVHVYTTSVDGATDLDVPIGQPVDVEGVLVHYFPVPTLRRLCWAPALATQLRETIHSFHVVHLHSVWLWPTYAAARIAHRAGVPYLLAPRGMLMAGVLRERSPWVKRAWLQLIEKHSLREAAGIHVTAQNEGEELAAQGLARAPIHCVPNGVEHPTCPAPLENGPFADLPRPYALFLSRISWKKGLDRLIRAWRHVPDLLLVIAGNDDESYLPELRRIAQQEGVTDRVRFIGPASDSEKWGLYANAEMFLLPSYSENFGNVVAEAMAMRCPVVITEDVGIAPLVREADAGRVTSGDPLPLAATINALHADPTLRRRLGANGHAAVERLLSWNAVGEQIEHVYRRVAVPVDAARLCQPEPG